MHFVMGDLCTTSVVLVSGGVRWFHWRGWACAGNWSDPDMLLRLSCCTLSGLQVLVATDILLAHE